MKTIEQIKQTEIEIRKLITSNEKTDKAREERKLSKQLQQLNFDQDTAVMNYLEVNDNSYYIITHENFDLLINDNIEFTVTKEDWGIFNSHATELKGDIHDNGFFYAQTTATDIAFFNFQKGFYPLGYQGLVNYFGETDLQITKRGFKFFGSRVPQKFIGSIDYEGNILMETTEAYWEYDGSIYVNRIIGDYFSGNSIKRQKFLENKEKLKIKISDFRANL